MSHCRVVVIYYNSSYLVEGDVAVRSSRGHHEIRDYHDMDGEKFRGLQS